jgi:succinate dehydrogenase / fumarate reductase iron-sulfur subunit
MTEKATSTRSVKVFRYDPASGGGDPGRFDSYTLQIEDEATTTILDVLLRVQREQDPSLAFRYACRVNMCGSCAMVINGKEALACKTNVSRFARDKEITIRPLNHFPVIKDLVVDMEPFFRKYEQCLPFYEPKEPHDEPARIRPDSRERLDIGLSTECIACGCCVSSCTMCHYHDGYAGPAALNRAFTLLADSRDGLYEERLTRVLESCYHCRTELNCTDVCPKGISGTRAIKHIQLLALRPRKQEPEVTAPVAAPARAPEARSPETPPAPSLATLSEALLGGPPAAVAAPPAVSSPPPAAGIDRRAFLQRAGIGLLGLGSIAALGGVAGSAMVGPTLSRSPREWVPVGSLDGMRDGDVTTVVMNYDVKSGLYRQPVSAPVLVSRTGNEIVCFKANCPHLGCIVKWESLSGRFRCACHGGTFDRDGTVLGGPPPRPLDRYAFKIDSGHLLVEVSS